MTITKRIEKLKKVLISIPKIIKTTKSEKRNTFLKKKVCKEKVFGFKRNIKKYRCIPLQNAAQTESKEVCEEQNVIDGSLKCTKHRKVYKTEACEKWTFDDDNEINCTHKAEVWPKFTCVEHGTHNGSKYCARKVFFKPRFVCDKNEILNNKKYCVHQQTFYGRRFHTFVCQKTGEIIKKEALDEEKNEPKKVKCETCTDYKLKSSSLFGNLDMEGLFEEEDGRLLKTEVRGNGVYGKLIESINFLDRRDTDFVKDCLI